VKSTFRAKFFFSSKKRCDIRKKTIRSFFFAFFGRFWNHDVRTYLYACVFLLNVFGSLQTGENVSCRSWGTFSSERLAIGETIDTFWSRFLFFLLRFGDPSLFVSQAFVFILGTVMMSPRNTKRYM